MSLGLPLFELASREPKAQSREYVFVACAKCQQNNEAPLWRWSGDMDLHRI